MVRIKVLRLSTFIYFITVIILLAAIIFLSYRLIIRDPVTLNPILRTNVNLEPTESTANPMYKSMLAGGFPAVATVDGTTGKKSIFSSLWGIITRKDLRNPRNIIGYQMPYLDAGLEVPDNAIAVSSSNVTLPNRGDIDRSSATPDKAINGGSDEDSYYGVSDEIRIAIEQLKVDKQPIELTENSGGPQILIYHSHERESYRQDPKNPYKEAFGEDFRSDDHDHTVVQVGEVLTSYLTQKGLKVLHDTTDHEKADYNASYAKSLQTLNKRMEENDSLQMFIDIHRNGYEKGAYKNPDEEVVIINGERVAKLFVVIGTGEGVMGGFNQKPKWEENTKLAIKLTNKLNEMYPGLAKSILFKSGRYNQHVSTNAILIEVGSTFTTQREAERATKYLAEALSRIIE